MSTGKIILLAKKNEMKPRLLEETSDLEPPQGFYNDLIACAGNRMSHGDLQQTIVTAVFAHVTAKWPFCAAILLNRIDQLIEAMTSPSTSSTTS